MKEKISKEQYLWLVDKGIIHEGMMVNLNGCDYVDFKIIKLNDTKLEVKNMENDSLLNTTYNIIGNMIVL